MSDPYQCLRCTSISIGVYNLIYCLAQFGILGWQTQVVKVLQWEYENRQLPPTHAIDGFQARFPGLYQIYTETPERRRINAMYVICLITLGVSFVHLLTTVSMLYGVIKREVSFICPWFFTGAPLIMLATAYAILWWSGDVFNEQLTMSVTEFVISLAINGPCYIVVLMYYLRISGHLHSDKPPSVRFPPSPLPPDVPPWQTDWPKDPPYEIQKKLRRRESPYRRAATGLPPSVPSTSAEFAQLAQNTQRSRYSSRRRPASVLKSRSATPSSAMRRKSPQRVSFKNRPKVYERTPSSSHSGGRLEVQTVV